MNAALPSTLALALLPMAPAGSVVHTIVEANRLQADLDYLEGINTGCFEARRHAEALRLQIEKPLFGVRS